MMLDTVNFCLTQAEVEGADFLTEVTPYLDRVAEHNYEGNYTVTGSLSNYSVSITPFQVRVKDGSLCKWYLGDNFKSMCRRDIQHAIEKLSDELHLPMDKASVKRLDVAENIITRHPVSVYLSHLGVLPYANRLVEPNSLPKVELITLKTSFRVCLQKADHISRCLAPSVRWLNLSVPEFQYRPNSDKVYHGQP